MATRRAAALQSVESTLTPHRAIELIRGQLEKFAAINALRRGDPEITKWRNTTEAILDAAFGKPNGNAHNMTLRFTAGSGAVLMNMSPAAYENEHHKGLLQKKAVLESCIEQLEILAPPSAQAADGRYQFHSEIERVSGALFRDGHYKQAALEAYIRVIDEVKQRSGLNLDGDNLMNQTFGSDGRIPALKFNSLSSDAERDEQNDVPV